ncbi:hypothetical protein SAMN05216490_5034 [Mucilaginibacter mallensis]|uniref:Uncharacterized protein n=1 Tax=Mucilaginibacter mallensis TaxID=652787 RepID=A0A1H2CH28_MUCMA|nr:hypothetical protein [Mucilaginibacter mallensis]SDT69557.1 hypothetical protein SAMN05216490_5034 [Mucilaginibacter mallensis]
MNWKLIFQLSLFGLIMAFGTVSLIPEKTEGIFWVVIFIFCAYVIAKRCTGRYFLYGFLVSIFNSVWITLAHVIFYNSYILHHMDMAKMGDNMHVLSTHPRLLMIILSPIFGAIFGLFQGLFAFIASKIVKGPMPKAQV